MGIEYYVVNPDKKEFLDFGRLGFGTKIGTIIFEPFASFLSWLLINREGYGDSEPMMGRWAGTRIEIVGDGDGEESYGTVEQEKARREFRDITVEAIQGFSDAMPYERITMLQPMGLIDKDGFVVADSKSRDAVRKYWEEKEAQENKELARVLAENGPGGFIEFHDSGAITWRP